MVPVLTVAPAPGQRKADKLVAVQRVTFFCPQITQIVHVKRIETAERVAYLTRSSLSNLCNLRIESRSRKALQVLYTRASIKQDHTFFRFHLSCLNHLP